MKKNLLVITFTDYDVDKYLFENISTELFDLYLTANNKNLDGGDMDEACDKLNLELQNAIKITNATDDRLKNLDGIITIGIIV
ncbi:MAG: hypothetical protein LW595_06465 [Rickettsiales bacterium]|nr:hypothetical protein [Rickettsiales bacterium]